MLGYRRDQLRAEVRGYSDYYAIIPNSNGELRSEIQTDAGVVVGRANGASRAPLPQLRSCLNDGAVTEGAACP